MNESYGKFIKKHRLASGYKRQRHFAETSGISTASMSRIEKELQKPNVDLLKTLARHLHSTTLMELMAVCGYWDYSEVEEKRLLAKVEIDGQPLTENEVNGIVAYVRALRHVKKQNHRID